MQLEKTFFDYLSISSSENIHSKTIAWIFSLPEDILSTSVKEIVLKSLLGVDVILKDIYCGTEINKLDILIDSEDYQIIIENKLKSSEHSNQTNKYLVDHIPIEFKPNEKKQLFGFLTLVEDKPENSNWIPISYEKLFESLKIIELDDTKEHLLIKEYIAVLNNLVSVYKDFIKNHKQYNNVFTDGSTKKYEKQGKLNTDYQDYIRKNNLETIFQKAFLHEILNSTTMNDFGIGEPRGNALAQVDICSFKYGGHEYKIGIQFQQKALKINLQDADYNKSKKEDIEDKLIPAFKKVFYRECDYNRLNHPTTKAYISVSKQIEKELYELEKEEIVEILNKEYKFVESRVGSFNKEIGVDCSKKLDSMKATDIINKTDVSKTIRKDNMKEKASVKKNEIDSDAESNRKDWINRNNVPEATMGIIDGIFYGLEEITEGFNLNYLNKTIGLIDENNDPKNFISFAKRANGFFKMAIRLTNTDENDTLINILDIESFEYHDAAYNLKIKGEGFDINSNIKVLRILAKKAKEEYFNRNLP